jgi:hypothetical protein
MKLEYVEIAIGKVEISDLSRMHPTSGTGAVIHTTKCTDNEWARHDGFHHPNVHKNLLKRDT